ncbi:hypothetical protein [Alcanivorax sp.]|uniref:hypothetical protein n=1 Tax=Alcanivorax sp. TaxID=1872427 RepID=UPI000C0D0977|nr:hypothetical protein [Alcanivorax sp.]PHR67951.1 MAG: hypothetical protein COA55_03500 [Alcanivorax sp.]
MEFVNTTQMEFEPGAAGGISLAVAEEAYSTPVHLRPSLGDLSRLSYIRAKWAVDLDTTAAGTADVTVQLKAGATVVAERQFPAVSGRVGELLEVDISAVPGSAALAVHVVVDTLEAATEASLKSWLQVEHPLVISNC